MLSAKEIAVLIVVTGIIMFSMEFIKQNITF